MTPMMALFAIGVTLLCYELAELIYRWSGQRAIFNSLLWSVVFVIVVLLMTGVSYDDYFAGTQFLHFLLGPATVALAVPLYEQRERVRSALLPLAAATLAGAVTSIGITVGLLNMAGISYEIIASSAPKSITTPVAMALAEQVGGVSSLTVGFVLITGITGSVTAPAFLRLAGRLFGQPSEAAQGFALGMCAHGAGTARAFQDGNEPGAFAGLAIGLHALVTVILVPIVMKWVSG